DRPGGKQAVGLRPRLVPDEHSRRPRAFNESTRPPGLTFAVRTGHRMRQGRWNSRQRMRWLGLLCLLVLTVPAAADVRITRDHGGTVDAYKAKYARLAAGKERVVIDGVCNSACTLVLGIVPLKRVCATPRASLG